MICPHCHGENNEGKKFCKHCGESFVIQEEKNICLECHADNSLGAKFCKRCGASLAKEVVRVNKFKEQSQTQVSVGMKKPSPIMMIGTAALIIIGSIGGVIYYKGQDIQPPIVVAQSDEIPTETVVQSPVEENAISPTVDETIVPSAPEQGNTIKMDPAPLFTKSTNINNEEYLALKSMSPAFASADQKLNKAFSKLRKELSPSERERLKKDQIKWIDQRNKLAFARAEKGSEAYIQSLIEQSNQREKELLRTIPKKAALQTDDSYLDEQMKQLENFDK